MASLAAALATAQPAPAHDDRRRARRPARNDEYLLYQTLLGAWPLEPMDDASLALFRSRIQDYMLKAAREAKVRTSWINPNLEYEAALGNFVDGALTPLAPNAFLQEFLPAQAAHRPLRLPQQPLADVCSS